MRRHGLARTTALALGALAVTAPTAFGAVGDYRVRMVHDFSQLRQVIVASEASQTQWEWTKGDDPIMTLTPAPPAAPGASAGFRLGLPDGVTVRRVTLAGEYKFGAEDGTYHIRVNTVDGPPLAPNYYGRWEVTATPTAGAPLQWRAVVDVGGVAPVSLPRFILEGFDATLNERIKPRIPASATVRIESSTMRPYIRFNVTDTRSGVLRVWLNNRICEQVEGSLDRSEIIGQAPLTMSAGCYVPKTGSTVTVKAIDVAGNVATKVVTIRR